LSSASKALECFAREGLKSLSMPRAAKRARREDYTDSVGIKSLPAHTVSTTIKKPPLLGG
jgi:hypothetical protein